MARTHEGVWPPIPDAMSPLDQRGGVFHAYEPDPLMGRPLMLSDELLSEVERIEQACRGVARFGAGFERFFGRVEAIASSRLNGMLGTSPYDVVLAEMVSQEPTVAVEHPDSYRTARNVEALRYGTDQLPFEAQLSVEAIEHLQQLLISDEPQFHGLRRSQTWTSGSGPVSATYVPPPPEYVPGLMADLVAYLETDEHPALVQAALVYAQVMLIRPLVRGNGRVGRALVATVLRRRGVMPNAVLPVSAVMFAQQRSWTRVLARAAYAGLPTSEEARAATERWVDRFINAAELTALLTLPPMAVDLQSLQVRWRQAQAKVKSNPQVSSALLQRLMWLLPERPILTAGVAAAELSVPVADAEAALEQLWESPGIVGKAPVGPALQGYLAIEVMEMVEEATKPVSETKSVPPESWVLNYVGVAKPPR